MCAVWMALPHPDMPSQTLQDCWQASPIVLLTKLWLPLCESAGGKATLNPFQYIYSGTGII